MSRKHYVLVAQVIARRLAHNDTLRAKLVDDLVPIYKADNSAFSANRFAAACNVPTIYDY